VEAVLCTHDRLLPSDSDGKLNQAVERAMDEILGPLVGRLRSSMESHYDPKRVSMPPAEATILWLCKHAPDYAEPILARARHHYGGAGFAY
jgi:hypothetical protein